MELWHLFLSDQVQMVLVAVILLQFINWVVEAFKFKVLLQLPEKPKIKLIIKAIYIGNFTALFRKLRSVLHPYCHCFYFFIVVEPTYTNLLLSPK